MQTLLVLVALVAVTLALPPIPNPQICPFNYLGRFYLLGALPDSKRMDASLVKARAPVQLVFATTNQIYSP